MTLLTNDDTAADAHEVVLNTTEFPDGIYFHKLKAGKFVKTREMPVLNML